MQAQAVQAQTIQANPVHALPQEQSKTEKPEVVRFRKTLESQDIMKAISDVLPAHKKKDMDRILRIALMEFKNNPSLHTCSIKSVLTALMNACRYGLEVGSLTGHAYLIPYKDTCQLQVGYKGLLELAYRKCRVLSVSAMTVFENDDFEILGGTERAIKHKVCLGKKGNVIGYYVVVDLQNTRPVFRYMSVEEIADHRAKFAKGGGKFWDNFPEQMAYKTIFIKLAKWLPNNEFLKDIAEIEASAHEGSIEGEIVSCETKASRLADAITDESQEQEGTICEDYDQQYPYDA